MGGGWRALPAASARLPRRDRLPSLHRQQPARAGRGPPLLPGCAPSRAVFARSFPLFLPAYGRSGPPHSFLPPSSAAARGPLPRASPGRPPSQPAANSPGSLGPAQKWQNRIARTCTSASMFRSISSWHLFNSPLPLTPREHIRFSLGPAATQPVCLRMCTCALVKPPILH